jgi:hypothetical protein
VTVLLDENFPMALLRALREVGIDAEHIITLGQRGISDTEIRTRLRDEQLLFVTQDTDFLVHEPRAAAIVLVSTVRQARPIADRVAIWMNAVQQILAAPVDSRLLEISDSGQLAPWTDVPRR